MRNMGVSIGYNELYGIKILAGRDFTATDYDPDFRKLHNMLINETAVKLLGFKSKKMLSVNHFCVWF